MNADRSWARQEFGNAALGDARRGARLVRLVDRLAQGPRGTVAGVYKDKAERQAAYDFLGNDAIRPSAILDATASATAQRCAGHEFAFVVVDGTSFTLTDRAKTKALGAIGARRFPTRGLMAIDALAVTPNGTPQGLWTCSSGLADDA